MLPSPSVESVASISDVVARLEEIASSLPPDDGMACFNRMYLEVTREVGAQVGLGTFADGEFVTHLDVVFADYYFAAVDSMSGPGSTWPEAWRPLLTARSTPGIEPIQFALAGMNAHINHDLPLAVVRTCTDLATAPSDGAHRADYQRVDALLDAAEQSVRESFEPQDVRDVDSHVAAVANLVGSWSINTARDVAWDTALGLWEVRDESVATELMSAALARVVAMASQALLVAL